MNSFDSFLLNCLPVQFPNDTKYYRYATPVGIMKQIEEQSGDNICISYLKKVVINSMGDDYAVWEIVEDEYNRATIESSSSYKEYKNL